MKSLNWDVMSLTTFNFTESLMTLGVLYPTDSIENQEIMILDSCQETVCKRDAKNLNKLIRVLCRATTLMPSLWNQSPLLKAANCVKLARELYGIKPIWCTELEDISGLSEEQLNIGPSILALLRNHIIEY